MTFRPIIFTAESVRAILAGRKTQTRRLPKRQPGNEYVPSPNNFYMHTDYVVGDLLWVREAWAVNAAFNDLPPRDLPDNCGLHFLASRNNGRPFQDTAKIRSARFLLKKFARIWVRVTAVRVERLQEITLRDVWAEGCEARQFALFGSDKEGRDKIGRLHFQPGWDSINAKRAPWASNPWVVVVTFERVKP